MINVTKIQDAVNLIIDKDLPFHMMKENQCLLSYITQNKYAYAIHNLYIYFPEATTTELKSLKNFFHMSLIYFNDFSTYRVANLKYIVNLFNDIFETEIKYGK